MDLTKEQVEYQLTCLISKAIRNVSNFVFKRRGIPFFPSAADRRGEFVTQIRRMLYGEYSDLIKIGFVRLEKTGMWVDVGIPMSHYMWEFTCFATDGVFVMDQVKAQAICENAANMAKNEMTIDDKFMEISDSLNTLMRETTALDTLVCKAKDLNAKASVVVDTLFMIAGELKELPNG